MTTLYKAFKITLQFCIKALFTLRMIAVMETLSKNRRAVFPSVIDPAPAVGIAIRNWGCF